MGAVKEAANFRPRPHALAAELLRLGKLPDFYQILNGALSSAKVQGKRREILVWRRVGQVIHFAVLKTVADVRRYNLANLVPAGTTLPSLANARLDASSAKGGESFPGFSVNRIINWAHSVQGNSASNFRCRHQGFVLGSLSLL